MSSNQFIVTDIDFQQLQNAIDDDKLGFQRPAKSRALTICFGHPCTRLQGPPEMNCAPNPPFLKIKVMDNNSGAPAMKPKDLTRNDDSGNCSGYSSSYFNSNQSDYWGHLLFDGKLMDCLPLPETVPMNESLFTAVNVGDVILVDDMSDLCGSDQSNNSPPLEIKEEDLNRNDNLMYLMPSEMQGNAEYVEAMNNTLSIPENYMSLTDDQINHLLSVSASNATNGEDMTKAPLDFSSFLKIGGVKNESGTSHFVKYKPDENGKHMKIWECGICHKEFGHQYILMRHLPTHTDERKFQCKQCGKAFRQMSTLSQHRAIHSKLRPYICEICQKTFNRVSTLISHRKTHTGLKPHRCHLCNKAFHQKGNLRNHIFTHTNARPYKCDVCQKGFNQMSNLMCHKFKAHQRADKPKYPCQTCGKEFEKRIGLRNHEQYEHGESSGSATVSGAPSVKYTNGVLVNPINTAAMRHSVAINQVPFALLRPLNGIPVLVRVLPAGDKQMLVPATAEDLKKHGEITIKKKDAVAGDAEKKDEDEAVGRPQKTSTDTEEHTATISGPSGEDNKDDPPTFHKLLFVTVTTNDHTYYETTEPDDDFHSELNYLGATVQIRIPVVASVIQRCRDGAVHMDIESPGPRNDGQEDSFVFTTTDEEFNQQNIDCSVLQESKTIEISNADGLRYYDLTGMVNHGEELGLINDIQLFQSSIINLDEDQNMLQSNLFNDQPGAEIYEIIDGDASTSGMQQSSSIRLMDYGEQNKSYVMNVE